MDDILCESISVLLNTGRTENVGMEKTKDQGGHAPAQPAAAEIPAFLINGKRVIRIATTLFLIAILFVFPIYYRDYYFDIPKASTLL